jgi:hypothetical protein
MPLIYESAPTVATPSPGQIGYEGGGNQHLWGGSQFDPSTAFGGGSGPGTSAGDTRVAEAAKYSMYKQLAVALLICALIMPDTQAAPASWQSNLGWGPGIIITTPTLAVAVPSWQWRPDYRQLGQLTQVETYAG